MTHLLAFYQDLHCLQKYPFGGSQSSKGWNADLICAVKWFNMRENVMEIIISMPLMAFLGNVFLSVNSVIVWTLVNIYLYLQTLLDLMYEQYPQIFYSISEILIWAFFHQSWILSPVLFSHLLMFLGSLYCKQYGPWSDCSHGKQSDQGS